MFETIRSNNPIPNKVWLRATDVLADYARGAEAFVASGRPSNGPIADEFARIEREYNQMADALIFAKWTPEQRREWDTISATRADRPAPNEEGETHA